MLNFQSPLLLSGKQVSKQLTCVDTGHEASQHQDENEAKLFSHRCAPCSLSFALSLRSLSPTPLRVVYPVSVLFRLLVGWLLVSWLVGWGGCFGSFWLFGKGGS